MRPHARPQPRLGQSRFLSSHSTTKNLLRRCAKRWRSQPQTKVLYPGGEGARIISDIQRKAKKMKPRGCRSVFDKTIPRRGVFALCGIASLTLASAVWAQTQNPQAQSQVMT